MKSIMTSVSPYLCEKIANCDCKILIKKSAPKEVPFKVFIYCTKMRKKADLITKSENFGWIRCAASSLFNRAEEYDANGKVIGEFICDKIEMINAKCSDYGIDLFYHDCLTKGCLTEREIEEYFNIPEDKDLRVMKGNGYGWHISNLKIYDKPKTLAEFHKYGAESFEKLFDIDGLCPYCSQTDYGEHKYDISSRWGMVSCEECWCEEAYENYLDENFALTRPPQSYIFVEEIEQ